MEAIRQIVKVKNDKTTITLPEDFSSEEVEVIILSSKDENYTNPQWQMNQVKDRTDKYLKNPGNFTDIDDFLKEIENELLNINH
jgi:uncharacterized protein YpuA (DUF1002 family)